MSADIFLAGAVRTPIGKFGGAFRQTTAMQLGAVAAVAALERAGVRPDQIDQVIFGHARQAGCGPNPARQVGYAAGVPVDKPAFTVNQACLSGMQALFAAARTIRAGEAECVLAGGMESMSLVPYLLPQARFGNKLGHQELTDAMYQDGFRDPLSSQLMGRTAENLAEIHGIDRDAQDRFAAATQARCQAARQRGAFEAEIVGVDVRGRKGTTRVEADEHPRDGVTPESLAHLTPVFKDGGTVTAGNSSGITDGAASLVVVSGDAARKLGIEPQARLIDYAVVGVEPAIMGIGPVQAVRQVLEQSGRRLEEVDLVELNEAFAAQVLAVQRALELDLERTNVLGGAIALGHPIGCSGARIVVTLLHEMARRTSGLGLATLCVSGGMGGAMLIERC